MSIQGRILLSLAALSLLCATAGGAAASHLLDALDERTVGAFGTAVNFQFFHGLGIFAVTLAAERYRGRRALWLAAWLLIVGTVLFCGSIYATTFGAPAVIGSAAPTGGIAFMAGWVAVAVAMFPGEPRS